MQPSISWCMAANIFGDTPLWPTVAARFSELLISNQVSCSVFRVQLPNLKLVALYLAEGCVLC
jgi:hypothetical protein